MAKKQVNITNKKQRVVLSDVLPFETPATFSNRHFYDFLVDNNIVLDNGTIRWNDDNQTLKTIIKLLFGISDGDILNESTNHIKLKVNEGALKTVPFQFKISHKQKEFRELTVVHPKSQLAVSEFYDHYRSLIIYYCNISQFSLRRPFRIAKFTYFKDRLHYEKLAVDHEQKGVEEFDKEYENLKTFFAYKEIGNIHKFYESHKYHRCEKKFKHLYKFDISKCFDSIYSHSIVWVLVNKDIIKDNIGKSKTTFGGRFDRLVQDLNYGETNGIVIGPEFSRIFAEIILQEIDRSVEMELASKKDPLYNRVDFEIFRYVDDYFVFYNDENVKDEVVNRFRFKLRDYKLGLNEQKSEEYAKPILTGITVAKTQIVKLLSKNLSLRIQSTEGSDEKQPKSIYASSNKLITDYKIIVKKSGIKYKDIQNFTLGCLENKTVGFIRKFWLYSNIWLNQLYFSNISMLSVLQRHNRQRF